MKPSQKVEYRELADFLQNVGKDPSRLVFEDELTGINNRRFLLSYFEQKVRWESGEDFPISLLVLDLDDFKGINDTHGHDAGDQVLTWVASLLKESAGETGLPIRYGGDEFMMVLPGLDRNSAQQVAYGVLQKTQDKPFVLREVGAELPISVSIGLASAPEDATSSSGLFQAADSALYHAKRAGKNRVSTAWEIDLEDVFEKTAIHKLDATGLTGRQEEFAEVSECIQSVAEGTDQFLVIQGTPGMGKTTFLDTIRSQLTEDERFNVVHVSGVQEEAYRPYYLAGRLLTALLHDLGEGAEEILESLTTLEVTYLSHILPQLAVEDPEAIPKDESTMREGIFSTVAHFVPRIAGDKPLALLVDDLQFADEATLLVLRTMIQRDELTLFVCAASLASLEIAGQEEAPPLDRFLSSLQYELGIRRLQLSPLSSGDIRAHLQTLFPGLNTPERFERELVDTTQGNPLFIAEIIRKLVTEQKLTFVGQEWAIAPLEEGYLPRSLEEIVQQKITDLDAESRNLLEQASTFGEEVSLSALAGSAEVQETKVLEFLDRAEALGLVKLGFQVNDEIMHFLGKQVLEISYGTIDEERRQELHERVASFQEVLHEQRLLPSASLLAYHFKRSANQDKARRYEQMHLAYSETVFNSDEAFGYTGDPVEGEPEAGEPLDADGLRLVPDAFRTFLTAVRSIQLYPAESKAIVQSRAQAVEAIHRIIEKVGPFNLSVVDRVLNVNGEELDATEFRTLADSVVELLTRADLRVLVFRPGVTDAELRLLLDTLAVLKPEEVERGFWKRFATERNIGSMEFRQARYSAVRGEPARDGEAAELTRMTEQALGAEDLRDIPGILKAFLGAAKSFKLYPPGSKQVTESIDEFHRSVQGVLARHSVISLAGKDEALLANGVKVNVAEFATLAGSFLSLARSTGLRSLTFAANLSKTELETFFKAMRELPTTGTDPQFWIDFNAEKDLRTMGLNQRQYALRIGLGGAFAAATELDDDEADSVGFVPTEPGEEAFGIPETGMPVGVPGDLPEGGVPVAPEAVTEELVEEAPLPEEPVEGAPDIPHDAILQFGKDLLVKGDNKVFQQLLQRVFEEYPNLGPAERAEVLQSCAALMNGLILALQHKFGDLASDTVTAALAAEDNPNVLAEMASLLHRMAGSSVQFSDYQTASRIFSALSSRRGELAGSEDKSKARGARSLDVELEQSLHELLIEDFRSGETSRQERAAQVLGSLGSPSIPLLIEVIKQEKDLRVRQLSARILADMGSEAVVEIKRALSLEVTVEQRFHILEVIDTITGDLRDELTYCLGDANPKIRRAAFRLAERLSDDALVEVMIPFVSDEDPNVAKGTIRSLANLGTRTAVRAVISILDLTKEPEVAVACCQALGQIADPSAIDALNSVVSPKGFLGIGGFSKGWTGQVRATAVIALRQFEDPRAAQILAKLAKDKDPVIRQLATSKNNK